MLTLTPPSANPAAIPFAQRPAEWAYLLVRTTGDPHGIVPSLRRVVAELDRNLPVAEVRTLEDVVAAGLADRRLAMSLFGVFSVLSLVLAALGLYAVISYMVVQRRQEIGIRMAIGAQRSHVLGLVMSGGLKLVAAGIGIGLVGALALARLLRSMLFGVTAHDPVAFAGNAALLLAVAALACSLPALRASRVDPMATLRAD